MLGRTKVNVSDRWGNETLNSTDTPFEATSNIGVYKSLHIDQAQLSVNQSHSCVTKGIKYMSFTSVPPTILRKLEFSVANE